MNDRVEKQQGTSAADWLKWLIVAALLIGGVYGYYYFSAQLLPIRILGLLAAIGLAAFVATSTEKGRNFVQFYRDADIERRKVVWPTRQETLQTTIIVLVVVVIVGLFIWFLDWIFAGLVKMIVG